MSESGTPLRVDDRPEVSNPTFPLATSIEGAPEPSLGSLLVPDQLAVWAWVFGYAALLTSLSVLRYGLWIARGDDLGVYEQGLWLLLHHGLGSISTYSGAPILARSASYILVVLSPLYAVGGVGLLLTLQALAIGMGYYFIRRIGSAFGVPASYAHIAGILYLLYPTNIGVNLFDFHPQALGLMALLGLITAIIEHRHVAASVLMLVCLLIGDAVPIVLAGLGVSLLLQRRAAWACLLLAVAAVGGYLDLGVLLAKLGSSGGPEAALWSGLQHLGHDPGSLIAWVHSRRAWEFLIWMGAPLILLGASFRAVNLWAIPAVVVLEANLISGAAALESPFTQGVILAVPFLFVALLRGMARAHLPLTRGRRLIYIAPALAMLCVFAWQQYHSYWRTAPPNTSALQAATKVIPADAPVLAQQFVLPHVADRVQEWPLAAVGVTPIPRGTYVILDKTPGLATSASAKQTTQLQAMLAQKGQVQTVFSQSGVIVVRLMQPIPVAIGGSA